MLPCLLWRLRILNYEIVYITIAPMARLEFAIIFWACIILYLKFGSIIFIGILALIFIPYFIILFINWKKNKDIREAWDEYYEDIYEDVWDRDGGKCVKCGSDKDLEFDQIIPQHIMGIPNTNNFQLLCQICSNKKVKYN